MSLTLPPLTASTVEQIIPQLRAILAELEGQVASQPSVAINAKSTKNSMVADVDAAGRLHLGKANSKGTKRYLKASDLQVLQNLGTTYLGIQTTNSANPTTAEFPNQYDWGFWHKTVSGTIFLVINMTGSAVRSVQLT